MTHPLLSVVFLNFNRLKETRITLLHLLHLLRDRPDVEIIAVDNGSTDGTRAFLCAHRPRITVCALTENLGIGGLNRGFETARGKYILVLDDDSMPVDDTAVSCAIDHLERHPGTALVACRILTADGKPFRSWHLPAGDQPGPASCFVGCGFMIRRAVFQRIGWFPAHFFLYQNEIAVAIRLFQLGYEIDYLPSSRIIHRESPAGRAHWRRTFFPTRNTLWLIRKYIRRPEAFYLILSRLLMGLFRAIESGATGWFGKAVIEGLCTPVQTEVLPGRILLHIKPFREHNRLDHHIRESFRWRTLPF